MPSTVHKIKVHKKTDKDWVKKKSSLSSIIGRKKSHPQQSDKESVNQLLSDQTKKARLFFLAGGILFLVFGYFLSKPSNVSSTQELEQANSSSFATEPVKIDENFLKTVTPKEKIKQTPERITIPSLQIDVPVKQAKIINKYWEVFEDTAGWGMGSAYPDDNGNQVIFAHARDGLFLPLKNAVEGQLIYIFTKDKWYQYKISQIKEVLPTQIEVIAPTTEPILTLYTCSGFADSKRLIIVAKKNS